MVTPTVKVFLLSQAFWMAGCRSVNYGPKIGIKQPHPRICWKIVGQLEEFGDVEERVG